MTIAFDELIALLKKAGGWVPEPPPNEAFRITLKDPVGKVRIEQFHTHNSADNVIEILIDEGDSMCAIDFY